GGAGAVYLCHPFLVHAAQAVRGTAPRLLAQPPLDIRAPFALDGTDDDVPVAAAIRRGLGAAGPRP
ncbi:MAG: phytanoyl-CoA dioxygenase, partial [Acidimicrobiales bacterium]